MIIKLELEYTIYLEKKEKNIYISFREATMYNYQIYKKTNKYQTDILKTN